MKYIHNKGLKLSTKARTIRKSVVAGFAALLMTASVAGIVSAKEITSGGNPVGGGTAACSPVKSLSYKGDARVGETGFASIDINYSVVACDKNIPVRVEVMLTQNIAGAQPTYVDSDAVLSNKVTVFGVLVGKSYTAKVTVYNRSTNVVIGSSQIFAAAVRKVGV